MGPISGAVRSPESETVTPRETSGAGSAASDARTCRLIATKNARTFSFASRLLPDRKRRGAYAIYATCRTADDIVDASSLHPGERTRALRRFRDSVLRALQDPAEEPILRELARASNEFSVPTTALAELFEGLERDLGPLDHGTWSDLERYCEGVAGSVGEMCCAVFGVAADQGGRKAEAVSCARTLGVAMQLTNILRDVGEDATKGRCYLPRTEMERFRFGRENVLDGSVKRDPEAWRAFMAFQVERARDLYRRALPGIPLLQPDSQRCALACAAGYSKILDAIEQSGFDTLSHRVSATRLTLLGVAWRSWWGVLPTFESSLRIPMARQAAR